MNEGGVLSNRADEFLYECREAVRAAGRDPESFALECAKSMVQVNTPPVRSLAELAREYRRVLRRGHSAGEPLEVLLGSDPEPEKRQLGIVAPQGRSAATRAPKNGRVVRTPPGERLRGDRNLLAGEEVIARCPEPLRQPYKSPSCVLWRSDRRPAGGQEGHQSAAVYVVESQPYSYLDLRVDEHPDPGAELRRIYEVAKVELLPFIEALPARKNPKGGFGGRSGAP